jgi:hypothetical protein
LRAAGTSGETTGTPWAGAPGGLGEQDGGELPTRPLTAPATPPAPYGGGNARRPASESVAPPSDVPQTRYGRPSPASEPATEAIGGGTPQPGQPVAGSGGALPSRAARSEVVRETSILAGPSFDGFSAGRRGIREEESEALHPGRPARPRHAAPSETGEHSVVGQGEEATTRFTPMRATDPIQDQDQDQQATTRIGPVDPDVTTRLSAPSAPSAAEQAERRAAFARGEAERRADAQAELDRLAAERAADGERGDDEPPTSPWAAPPRANG